MKYSYGDSVSLVLEPKDWTKDSGKEVLQYAIGGLLYMPASNTSIAEKIVSGEYSFIKSMVLDLEDSLGDDMVEYGQNVIKDTLGYLYTAVNDGIIMSSSIPLIFIRVRAANQIKEIYNSLGFLTKMLTGFNIPKFDNTNCFEYVSAFEDVMALAKKEHDVDLYMMPIIESKFALYKQLRVDTLLCINDSLRGISDNILNIRVGGADFMNVFGLRRGVKDTIYDVGAVGDCLNDIINMFGKSYVMSGAVWEYFGSKDNLSADWVLGLKNELRLDRLNGFIGKTAIHPNQLRFINESLIVDNCDYQDAIRILGMNRNIVGVKKSQDGSRMNEVKTHSKWAQKIVGLANVYGVREKV